jgi:hypothetical protein
LAREYKNLMGRMVSTERNESRQIQNPKTIVFSMAIGTLRKFEIRSDLREADGESWSGERSSWFELISYLRCSHNEKEGLIDA